MEAEVSEGVGRGVEGGEIEVDLLRRGEEVDFDVVSFVGKAEVFGDEFNAADESLVSVLIAELRVAAGMAVLEKVRRG